MSLDDYDELVTRLDYSVNDNINSTHVPNSANTVNNEHQYWLNNRGVFDRNGYDVVPIRPNDKRPRGNQWQTKDFTITPIDKHCMDGIGIRARVIPAIDIDVKDTVIAEKLSSEINKILTENHPGKLLCRTGAAPKTLTPCKLVGDAFSKLSTPEFCDKDRVGHRVEILASGQQFVALGIHPSTGMPYKWDGGSPADVPADELPGLDEATARQIQNKCTEIFKSAGWTERGNGTTGDNAKANPNVDISMLTGTATPGNISDVLSGDLTLPPETFDDAKTAELRAGMDYIDFSKHDRDFWQIICAGCKHGSGNDERAFHIFDKQSRKDTRPKHGYIEGCTQRLWDSTKSATGPYGEARLGTVFKAAYEGGWDGSYNFNHSNNSDSKSTLALNFNTPIKPGEFPHVKRTSGGGISPTVKCTIENVKHLLDRYGITARFDVITKTHQFTGQGMPDDTRTGGAALAVNARVESLATLCGMSPDRAQKMANNNAMDNAVNPVVDYLSELEWDGKEHIKPLAGLIGIDAAGAAMRDELIKLFIIQACAAADWAEKTPNAEAKPKFESIIVFYSGQGVQKTKFLGELPPKPLRKYFADGMHLDPSNVDSVREVTGNWMIELGELDSTVRGSDISKLKAFASKSSDIYRTPYDKVYGIYQRRTVMCGTVNVVDFLRDRTGGRRFWPMEVTSIVLPSIAGINIDQVWAQGWDLYMSGEQWWPTPKLERVLDTYRARFSMDDTSGIGDAVARCFGSLTTANKSRPGNTRMSVSEIYEALFPHDLTPNRTRVTAVSHYMQQHNKNTHGSVDRKNHGGTNKWRMPPKK